MKFDKVMILIRGLPGSGKSTLAALLDSLISMSHTCKIIEADQFFYDEDGNYHFDRDKLQMAHFDAQSRANNAMFFETDVVIVSNTSTTEKEIKVYTNMAKFHNYEVISLIVENRHGNESIHGVPEFTLEKMRERFQVSL